ncbi:uncharacterized protein HGUI_00450 [Hanseniaspora guilliermondii]|uniref:Uncharacterized protein n=1 Tax=Hanseniaspora guilliermondii TaxID=56406 RepID=A0A1L0AUL0_9ASCO|nr:uncharacterized protein HGUI_00450 [Hanseniaspora guilliermondii]
MLSYDEILSSDSFKKIVECTNICKENKSNDKLLLALTHSNCLQIYSLDVKSSTKSKVSRLKLSQDDIKKRDPPIPIIKLIKNINLYTCNNINDILVIPNSTNIIQYDKIAILMDDKLSIIQYNESFDLFETVSLHQYGFVESDIKTPFDDLEHKIPYSGVLLSKNDKGCNGILLWKPNSIIFLNLLEANVETSTNIRVKKRKFNPLSKFIDLKKINSDLANIIDIQRISTNLIILYAPKGSSEVNYPGVSNKLKIVKLKFNDNFYDKKTFDEIDDEGSYTTILNSLTNLPDDVHSIIPWHKNILLSTDTSLFLFDEHLNTNYKIILADSQISENEDQLQFNRVMEDYKSLNVALFKPFTNWSIISENLLVVNNIIVQLLINNNSIDKVTVETLLNDDMLPYAEKSEILQILCFSSDNYYRNPKFLSSTSKSDQDVYNSLVVLFKRGDTAVVEIRELANIKGEQSLEEQKPETEKLDIDMNEDDIDLYGTSSIDSEKSHKIIKVKVLNPCLKVNYSPMNDAISTKTLGYYKTQQLALSPNYTQEDVLAVGPSYNTIYEVVTSKQHYNVKKTVKFVDYDDIFNLNNKYLVATSNKSNVPKSSILKIGLNNTFTPIPRLMDFQYDSATLACGLCKSLKYMIQVTTAGIWVLDMEYLSYKNKYIFNKPMQEASTYEDYISCIDSKGRSFLFMIGKMRMKPVALHEPPELAEFYITMSKLAYVDLNGVRALVKICLTASDRVLLFDVTKNKAKLHEIRNINELPNKLSIFPFSNEVKPNPGVSITNLEINNNIMTITSDNLFVCYKNFEKIETTMLKNKDQEIYMKSINEHTYTIGVDTLITDKNGRTKRLGHLASVVKVDSLGNTFLIDPIGIARLVNVNLFFDHEDDVIVHRLKFDPTDKKKRIFGSIRRMESENMFAVSYVDSKNGSGVVLLEYMVSGDFKVIDEYVCEEGYVVGTLNTVILNVKNVGADAFLARNSKNDVLENNLPVYKVLEKNFRRIISEQEDQVIPINIPHSKKVQLHTSYVNLHLPKITARSEEEMEFLVIGENEITSEFDLSRSRIKLFSIDRKEENPFLDLDYEREYKPEELEKHLNSKSKSTFKLEYMDNWDSAKGLITAIEETSGMLCISYSDGKTYFRRCLSATVGISSNYIFGNEPDNLLTYRKKVLEPVAFLDSDSMAVKVDTLGEGYVGVLDYLYGWSLYGLETEPYKVIPFSKEQFENDIILNSIMSNSTTNSSKPKLVENVVTVSEQQLKHLNTTGSMFGYNGKMFFIKFLNNGALKLLEFDPENTKSVNGTNLLLHQRYKLINCNVNSSYTVQSDIVNDDYSNNDVQYVICSAENGKIFKFSFLSELTFKKLSMLQHQIVLKTANLGGFNHKMDHEYNMFNKNNYILDMKYLKDQFIFNEEIPAEEKEKVVTKIFGNSTTLQELIEDVI